jgi:hypothetical protein
MIGRKCFRDHARDERRGIRRHFGRLQDRAVAGGDTRNQRPKREIERIIPRRDDKTYAARLRDNGSRSAKRRKRRRITHGPHPAFQVLQRVTDFLRDRQDFGENGFRFRLAEIGFQRRDDRRVIFPDRRGELFKRRAPLGIAEV